MMSHKEQENTGGGREEISRRGAENPEIFGDCKLATSSILLLFLLHFVATTLGRDPANRPLRMLSHKEQENAGER